MSKIYNESLSVIAFLSLVLTVIADGLLLSHCHADDWPQWLGPQRLPVWSEEGVIDTFPEQGPPLRWKAELGGGYSGPAVANGRVFVMDRVTPTGELRAGKLLHEDQPPSNQNFVRRLLPGRERVLCFRESDGKQLWTYEYDCPYTSVAIYAIGPRCTPTVDGDRVYTLGAEGDLVCLRVDDGSVVWNRNFITEFGIDVPEWGTAAHPLVDGERLICMVGGDGTTCVAFNKRNGKEIWRALTAKQPGYCPPVIYELGGVRQLVTWDSDAVSGLNPVNGEVYWRVPFEATFAMAISAPQREGNSLFLMAFNRKSAMIQVSADGRSAELVWQGDAKRGIDGVLNTAVIREGYVYGCGNGGRYVCAELKTGKRIWSTFAPSTGKRPASWANVFTVRHDDRYFLANDVGDLIIAGMTPSGYEERSRAHLIDPTQAVGNRTLVWSHPAFANRSIYLRNDKEIRCYSLAKSSLRKQTTTDPTGEEVAESAWRQLPDMPVGKWEAGTVVLDKKLYFFGGYTKGVRSSKRCDVFDPKDNSWTRTQDLPSAISHMNAVLDGRTVWFAGGFKDGYKGHTIAEVWNYGIDQDRYTAAPLLPETRGGGGLALLGRTLHYIGGVKADRDTDAADHWVLDLDKWTGESRSARWVNAAPLPAPRNQFSTITFEGKIYVIGGQFHHDSQQLDQARVDIYDPGTDSWSRGPSLPKGHSHSEGGTFVSEGRIFLVGGHTTPTGGRKQIDADILALAPGGQWEELVSKLPMPLSSPAAAIINGKLYVAGGSPNGSSVQAKMWVRNAP